MPQSNGTSILTHLGAFLAGVGAGLLAFYKLYTQKNQESYEENSPVSLELTFPENINLNPPHVGVYYCSNNGSNHQLLLYPTMSRMQPSGFLTTKVLSQTIQNGDQVKDNSEVPQTNTAAQDSNSAAQDSNTAAQDSNSAAQDSNSAAQDSNTYNENPIVVIAKLKEDSSEKS